MRKMKSCALSEVADASEQMRQMVETQAGEICNQLYITKVAAASYGFAPEHEVIQTATACLNSIAALTCDTMDTQTPECCKADAISQKYSADAE